MNDLSSLYQEIILDHNFHPHNYGEVKDATHKAEGFNPLCGDKVIITLKIENDIIIDINFTGSGCAISQASSSLLTTAIKGKSVGEAQKIFNIFHSMVTTDKEYDNKLLGKLTVFSGVKQFPMRVKCVTMTWHTLIEAIKSRI